MATLVCWILAVMLAIARIVTAVRGAVLAGIVLIVVGCSSVPTA
jgi:hypothetical protein